EVSESALKTYYLLADAFVTTSEHEGFCVPLVEAMALKVPVVAYGSSAIPGTVGDAGIVWNERDPDLLACSIHRMVSDRDAAATLASLGRARYESWFARDRIENQFVSIMDSFL